MAGSPTPWRTAAALGGMALTATAAAAGALAVGYTRQVVTPQRHRPDEVQLLEVRAGEVVLRADASTLAPGRYSLGVPDGPGGDVTWLQVGDVVGNAADGGAGRRGVPTVTRELLGTPLGPRGEPGPQARRAAPVSALWSGWFYRGDPSAVGLPFEEVAVTSDVGDLPAWFVPGSATTWAVLVHGRGASREECLRALPVLHRLGVPALVTSYRNDESGPPSPAGRYGLGDTEWVDVEAAVLHALAEGARSVVMFAWSMGGAIALSLVSRSWLADRVQAVVLDSPVLDWHDVLHHHARARHLPRPVTSLGLSVLRSAVARHAMGVDGPVDLRRMDWVRRADELGVPALVFHGPEDEFVPFGPSAALARARPDLVHLVPVPGAGHCRTWNVDPDRWDREVARFVLEHL